MSVQPRFRLLASRSEGWLELEDHRHLHGDDDGPVELSVYDDDGPARMLLTLGEVAELSALCHVVLGNLQPSDVLRAGDEGKGNR